MIESLFVKMVVGSSLSKEDFIQDKKEKFRQGLAATAGVLKENVRITKIDAVSIPGGDMLFGGFLERGEETISLV